MRVKDRCVLWIHRLKYIDITANTSHISKTDHVNANGEVAFYRDETRIWTEECGLTYVNDVRNYVEKNQSLPVTISYSDSKIVLSL